MLRIYLKLINKNIILLFNPHRILTTLLSEGAEETETSKEERGLSRYATYGIRILWQHHFVYSLSVIHLVIKHLLKFIKKFRKFIYVL